MFVTNIYDPAHKTDHFHYRKSSIAVDQYIPSCYKATRRFSHLFNMSLLVLASVAKPIVDAAQEVMASFILLLSVGKAACSAAGNLGLSIWLLVKCAWTEGIPLAKKTFVQFFSNIPTAIASWAHPYVAPVTSAIRHLVDGFIVTPWKQALEDSEFMEVLAFITFIALLAGSWVLWTKNTGPSIIVIVNDGGHNHPAGPISPAHIRRTSWVTVAHTR
jgi:hypothetical protein